MPTIEKTISVSVFLDLQKVLGTTSANAVLQNCKGMGLLDCVCYRFFQGDTSVAPFTNMV